MIFCTQNYDYLCDEVVFVSKSQRGEVERTQFPDGERYRRILTRVNNKDVIIIGGTISDEESLELYDMACALVKYGARSLVICIPYFGYSTMEREVLPGEVLPAKTRARLFSVIPEAPMGNSVMLLDLHTPSLPHYFEGNIRHVSLTAKKLMISAIKNWAPTDIVLAATDSGRMKLVEALASEMELPAAFVMKKRHSSTKTSALAVHGDVQGKNVVLIDDMIRSGSSLITAAQALKDSGCEAILAMATHGLFPGQSLEKLESSGLFENIVVSNSHPRSVELAQRSRFLKTESIAELICNALSLSPKSS